MTLEAIEALLEAVPLPTLLIGRSERILGANQRAISLLGQNNMVGRHFITAIRQPTVLDSIEACLADGKTLQSRFLSSDGAQDTTYVVNCSYLDNAEWTGALVCFEDVTQVEQVGQMRRDFVANVSHELRTPLTALLGFIETLRGPAREDPETTARFLEVMQTEASRMERLVKDLLSLSRVEAQERVRPKENVDLLPLLMTVLDGIDPIAKEASVEVITDLPENSIVVPGDTDQLQQVFTNLLENAIKYGGGGKQVRLSLSGSVSHEALRVPCVSVTVEDQGPGFDEAHLPRLTERFYRIDTHRSREVGGTGLGLAIVKHVINRHRGRLRIRSVPGEGSAFEVILPLHYGEGRA
ncbi:MAG: ATP-binding protein [Pseudomonadota bacterium]